MTQQMWTLITICAVLLLFCLKRWLGNNPKFMKWLEDEYDENGPENRKEKK